MSASILQVVNLVTEFQTPRGPLKAVEGINFQVERGKVVGIVGESGCGKSVTALSIMRLIPTPSGRIKGGQILFKGTDLLTLREKEMQKIRGKQIAMIFQEPMTSLNPVFTIGNQITEMLRLHLHLGRSEANQRAVELLQLVGIPVPERRIKEYPHQLSGGMRQRVMIAMAISCNPELIIADEPTTALDVTIQAQILALLQDLRQRLGMAMILISHDLGVIAEVAEEVAIMYAGRIVEYTKTEALFATPRHPYTKGLLDSLPRFENGEPGKRLRAITGTVPKLTDLPEGCKFAPRCSWAWDLCHQQEPDLMERAPGHQSRCWLEEPPA